MYNIDLKIHYNAIDESLLCEAKREDFNLRIIYSNVKMDTTDPTGLQPYLDDFLEEFEKGLNKHIEIYFEV